jgi:hypothetical protein
MLLRGSWPSRPLLWFALLREPPIAFACARPCSGSPPRPAPVTLTTCMFQVSSVKPRWYDQSCIRLCMANRFAAAASASLRWGEVNTSGLHRAVRHWSVNG